MVMKTYLLAVVLCELVEEPASLLGLEISQHGGDDGADVFYVKGKRDVKTELRRVNLITLLYESETLTGNG